MNYGSACYSDTVCNGHINILKCHFDAHNNAKGDRLVLSLNCLDTKKLVKLPESARIRTAAFRITFFIPLFSFKRPLVSHGIPVIFKPVIVAESTFFFGIMNIRLHWPKIIVSLVSAIQSVCRLLVDLPAMYTAYNIAGVYARRTVECFVYTSQLSAIAFAFWVQLSSIIYCCADRFLLFDGRQFLDIWVLSLGESPVAPNSEHLWGFKYFGN